jgi:3-phytase
MNLISRITFKNFLNTSFWCLVCVETLLSGAVASAQTAQAQAGTWPIGKADGVAIVVNASNPSKSIVLGSDPQKGLGSFDLNGNLIEVKNFGRGGSAGVDVRYQFPLGGEKTTLILSGNNSANTLRFFKMNEETRLLEEVTGERAAMNINAYGCCLYQSPNTGKFYAVATSREGLIEQWEIFDNGNGKVDAKLVREINILDGAEGELDPKTEACVADDELGHLYISQESECLIWRYGAEPEDGNVRQLVDKARINEGDNIEGLAIYRKGRGQGYLLVSVQGSFKYKVYDRAGENKFIERHTNWIRPS